MIIGGVVGVSATVGGGIGRAGPVGLIRYRTKAVHRLAFTLL